MEDQEHPIVERVRIECTDCGGLIDADMAIRHNDKPYCGECQDRHRPIVERPDWFFDLAYPGGSKMPFVKRYIEQLEKEKDRLEAAIRQKYNALEVCGERRWEAEEKVGELMGEVDRLNAVINNVRR